MCTVSHTNACKQGTHQRTFAIWGEIIERETLFLKLYKTKRRILQKLKT
jgi:hypothetical protein